MFDLIIKSIKPALAEYVDKAIKGAPEAIRSLLAQIVAWLPTTTDKATALFRNTYGSGVEKLSSWIPTQVPVITKLADQLGGWVKKRISAL